MRISCHKDHPDHRPELIGQIIVLLNGKPVDMCTYVDTYSGFVKYVERDEDGRIKTVRELVRDPAWNYKTIFEHRVVELVAYGRVEIVRRHRPVEVVREVQSQPVPHTTTAAPAVARALRNVRRRASGGYGGFACDAF